MSLSMQWAELPIIIKSSILTCHIYCYIDRYMPHLLTSQPRLCLVHATRDHLQGTDMEWSTLTFLTSNTVCGSFRQHDVHGAALGHLSQILAKKDHDESVGERCSEGAGYLLCGGAEC